MKVQFIECGVLPENQRKGIFASICITDGFEHPQGVGKTKKEAKTMAAHKAMNALLGIEDGYGPEFKDQKKSGGFLSGGFLSQRPAAAAPSQADIITLERERSIIRNIV